MLVDTHCHLCDARFDADRDGLVERARVSDVRHVIVIADSEPATTRAMEIALQYGFSATAGVHPHVASTWNEAVAHSVERALADPRVVAVGEAGLDYHYEHSPRDVQRRVFAEQLELAVRVSKPIVVHSRSADADMVAMLRDSHATAVLHSFSAGPDVLRVGLDRGDYISFSGMVTFKSWTDFEAVKSIPPSRILVETDAPHLAPVPQRGKRNEPAFVAHVAAKLAELRGIPLDEFAAQTTANAARCFGPRVTLQPFVT